MFVGSHTTHHLIQDFDDCLFLLLRQIDKASSRPAHEPNPGHHAHAIVSREIALIPFGRGKVAGPEMADVAMEVTRFLFVAIYSNCDGLSNHLFRLDVLFRGGYREREFKGLRDFLATAKRCQNCLVTKQACRF